jgi:hypothetical protein
MADSLTTPPQDKTPPDHELATTERGTRLDKFTEGDVNLALRMLILNGGNVGQTCRQLAEEGITLESAQLRYWRDVAFIRRHSELRLELARDVGEDIAGRAMERAIEYDDAQAVYVRAAVEKIDDVDPNRLAPNAASLAKGMAENIEKAQLLRNKPTEIRETRDTAELLDFLRKSGVLKADPREPAYDVDGNATEIETATPRGAAQR